MDSVFRVVDIADTGDAAEAVNGSPSSISHHEERKEQQHSSSPEPSPSATPSSHPPTPSSTASSPSASTSNSSGRMYKFKVYNSLKSFIVMTPDPSQKAAWLADLRQVIVDRRKTIQLPSRSSFAQSSHAPMLVGDNASTVCQRCEKKFSLTVRKHHCRSCGRLCCSECVGNKMMVRGEREVQRVCKKCAEKEETRLKKHKEALEGKMRASEREKERQGSGRSLVPQQQQQPQQGMKAQDKENLKVEQKDILGLSALS